MADSVSVLSDGLHIPAKMCQFTPDAFNGIFEALIKEGMKYENAYNVVEDRHIRVFGERRYASYDSFRKIRERRINS